MASLAVRLGSLGRLGSWWGADHSLGGEVEVAVLVVVWSCLSIGWFGCWFCGGLRSLLRITNDTVLCHIIMAWLSLYLLWGWLWIRIWSRLRSRLRSRLGCRLRSWSRSWANKSTLCQIKMAWLSHRLLIRSWLWWSILIWLWCTIWANNWLSSHVVLAYISLLRVHLRVHF